MSRHFILTLTLIVLIAMASAGWLGLGAIAGDYDPVPQHPWASKLMSGRRVYHRDTSEAESSNPFTTASEEFQEQAAFDDFAPSAEYESNEFAEIDPFVANEQVENPFAADPTAEHEALRAEPFEAPRDSKRKPSSTGLLRIRSDEAPDLDQPTRNALKEMVIQIEREADELQQLGRLKEAEHRRHVYRRLQALLEQRARQQNDQPKSMRFIELMETEKNHDANAGPEERKIQRKIEHLQRAIENLKQAGLEKQAQELEHQIARMKVELRVLRRKREIEKREWLQRHERGHAPRDDVHEALNDLRHEIRNLRNEVREMHELLEQHVKRGGKYEPNYQSRELEGEPRPFDESNIKKRGDQRNETEEIDTQARDEEEVEEEHEERPLPTPDYDPPPTNQPEQIEEAFEEAYGEAYEVLPSEENNVEAY